MRGLKVAAVTVILIGCVQSSLAFSPIATVNGWDADRLNKAGITVAPWKHDFHGEDPPLDWVQVTFDCSRLPKDHDVVMTAWIRTERRTVTALRAERNVKGKDTVALLFSIQPEYRSQSHVDIFIWRDTSDGGKEAYGYTLSMEKIGELAREEAADKAMESDKH
jgi:hypothetical protein